MFLFFFWKFKFFIGCGEQNENKVQIFNEGTYIINVVWYLTGKVKEGKKSTGLTNRDRKEFIKL